MGAYQRGIPRNFGPAELQLLEGRGARLRVEKRPEMADSIVGDAIVANVQLRHCHIALEVGNEALYVLIAEALAFEDK